MADVIHLERDDDPPADSDWVLVERTPSGQAVANGSVLHSRGATFFVGPQNEWEHVISDAKSWADRNGGIPVYVRGRD